MTTRIEKTCDICGMKSFEPDADFANTLKLISSIIGGEGTEHGREPMINISLADGTQRFHCMRDLCHDCAAEVYDMIESIKEMKNGSHD